MNRFIIGLSCLLTHLVPKNIENWLRRSLYGTNQETVKGKIFNDMIAEQSSLQMVLKGITVDVELNHVILRSGTEESYTDLKTYDLKAKVQYPKTIDDNINILITQGNSRKKIASIIKSTEDEIQNIFFGRPTIEYHSAAEMSIIKIEKENSQIFDTLDIVYVLGINREEEENIDIQFEIVLDRIQTRDIFYVSI